MNALISRWHRPSWRVLTALLAAAAIIVTGLVLRANATSTTAGHRTTAAGHRTSTAVHLAGYDTSQTANTPDNPNGPVPGMCTTRILNVRDTGESETWPSDPNWHLDAWGPVNSSNQQPFSESLTRSLTVGNTFHSTVGVDAKAVSAQVGFDVSSSDTVGTNYTISIPPNQEWRIAAGYVAHNYLYDVYRVCSAGTVKIGTGVASEYDHLVYQAYQIA
ncbi:hypothetical protein [Streptomyces roseochromogenus]|uniref:Uncharacterized protein n=1 Tax=Streptomyces roseochromogenus subsp. oscitans DS 12.976 TaxID=1352936 RepID=V6JNL7_STRRC|nr:hypothetical protein [Streptomyces roseochromogenus]EST18424.1 hypothetical protein M878_44720 [Streptomyces roseochromogenus subsp. oscitans DS 12.976]